MAVQPAAERMREIIDQATAAGGYVPRALAGEIVARLRTTDPELLADWLNEQAEQFVWQAINDRDRSVRSAARHRASRDGFRDAVDAAEHGDVEPLHRMMAMPFTLADGVRRPLAQLCADDLGYVADAYDQRAAENALMAAFLRALAKKVSTGTVADHYTESQLSAMFNSLRGNS